MSKISSLSVLFKWNKVKTSSNKTSPRSRCKHACCLHNEYAYVIGGKDGSVSLKDFWRFNIGTYKWEELTYRGEKIPYFEGHSLISHKRLLLLFGGAFGYDETESSLWIINPDLKYIRKHVPDIGSPQPCTRRNHTTVVYNNVMYVYGGFTDLKGSTSDIWAYHIDDEEWELITPNQRSENTAGGRHGHSAVVYGREMWVFGGMCGLQSKSDFWSFNFHSLKWGKLKIKYGPPCLSGHTATVVKDYMVIVGGESNGVMSSDIWVFGFCTLKWTHYQNTHQYPSPRKWHTIIPITARYAQGDNSVRTKSLPHLQKKAQKMVKRPKSSPVYYSARYSRKSPNEGDRPKINRPITLALNPPDKTNQNDTANSQIEMTNFLNKNEGRKSPYKGNGFPDNSLKQNEDKSPLLCNRQLSKDSVISNNSGLGTDNPCLELDSSCEKIDNFIKCESDNSDFLVSYEMKDFSEKRERTLPTNGNQVVTRYVKNKNQNFKTSYIPGQVNLTPTKTETLLAKRIGVKRNSENDLFVEDLEFYENYFSNSSQEINQHKRLSHKNGRKHSDDFDFKTSSNKDLTKKLSGDEDSLETDFGGKINYGRENSLEEKSYSMTDINESKHIQHDSLSSKSASMHFLHQMPYRKCSLNCWMEEAETNCNDVEMSSADVSSAAITSSKLLKDTDQTKKDEPKTSETKGDNSETSKETEKKPRKPLYSGKHFMSGSPYLLLIGGLEEKKGHTISVEPVTLWQCDVMVRHSDISHGEFYKNFYIESCKL